MDCAELFVIGVVLCRSDHEAGKLHRVGAKCNFLGICITSCRPQMSSQQYVRKRFSSRVSAHKHVIDAVGFVGKVIDNLVESSGVPFLWRCVALWTSFVSVPTPGRDESNEVGIFFSDWHTVIPVPSIGDRFLGLWRYQRCLVKRGLDVLCFTDSIIVDHLHVHCAPWLGVYLPNRDYSSDPEFDISVDRRLDFLLPVWRYWIGFVDCDQFGLGVDVEFQRRALH